MRIRGIAIATALLAALVTTTRAHAAGDRVIVRDSHVCAMFALHGTVFYVRAQHSTGGEAYCGQPTHRRWMRIVNGRARSVHGLPRKAWVSTGSSIGTDIRGRVVLTASSGAWPHTRWWLYDIAADAARRAYVHVPKGCNIDALAVWRTRVAYSRACGEWWRHPAMSGHFLQVGPGERRLADYGLWNQGRRLVIRGATVAGFGWDDGDDVSVGRIAERDRGCPALFRYGDWWGNDPRDVWLAADQMIWVTAEPMTSYGLVHPSLWKVAMPGTCKPLEPKTKLLDIPDSLHVQAVAVQAPYLYYADDQAIYRHRLSGL